MEKKQKLINTIKGLLRKNPVVLSMFEEFKVPLDLIDQIEMDFKEMGVSAKTKDKKIYINSNFLKDGDLADELHYFVHEMCHYLQQFVRDVDHFQNLKRNSYLDKPTEIEAFQYQVQFIRNQYGEARAREYVDSLINFHDLSEEDAKEKRQKLLGD